MINRPATFIPAPQALFIVVAFLATVGAVMFTFYAHILTVESASQEHAKIEIVSDETPASQGSALSVGLLFHLDKGWHIYWQNPGDSGEPPKIEWQLPPGYRIGPVEWPRPIRLGSGSVIDYGYENQVLLIASIRSAASVETKPAAPITADVKYVVCSQICVPGKAHLTLPIPTSGNAGNEPWHSLFRETRAQLPQPAPANWTASAKWNKDFITLSVRGQVRAQNATFFPLDPSVIDNAAPQTLKRLAAGFQLQLATSPQLLAAPAKLRGLVEFADGSAYQIAVPVSAAAH